MWEAVENQAHNDCKVLKQGLMETNRGTWDTVISRQANVSRAFGVYFPSLCQQCLLFAVEFIRVCPADNKSAAVWMQQACLLQLPLALLLGCSCCRKSVLPPGLEDVWLWDQFMGRIKLSLGALACFLLWVKQLIQKPSLSTAEIVQVLLALFVILPSKAAQELRTARTFKGNFPFYELLDRTE